VQDPDARIIRLEGDDKVPATRQHGDVAARRVGPSRVDIGGVEGSGVLGDDVEVVAVEVDGVRDGEGCLDDEVVPWVRAVDVQGIIACRGCLPVEDLKKGGVRPIYLPRAAV